MCLLPHATLHSDSEQQYLEELPATYLSEKTGL